MLLEPPSFLVVLPFRPFFLPYPAYSSCSCAQFKCSKFNKSSTTAVATMRHYGIPLGLRVGKQEKEFYDRMIAFLIECSKDTSEKKSDVCYVTT